jgi:hypothetical protein
MLSAPDLARIPDGDGAKVGRDAEQMRAIG